MAPSVPVRCAAWHGPRVLGLAVAAVLGALTIIAPAEAAEADEAGAVAIWAKIAPFFTPPAEYANDPGPYRSPLLFDDGRPVANADEWPRRRREILQAWHRIMGPWPPLVARPTVEVIETTPRDGFVQKKVRLPDLTPLRVLKGYLLRPPGDGPFPAVLVVYYDPETGAGLKPDKEFRDYGHQLARRGFVTLSIGWADIRAFAGAMGTQPLSYLAYVAANARNALATLPEVDPARIGVVGHSFGGKWAMFAAALDEKFACGAWSDPGIVFDEKRGNINYWDPWYLGWEADRTRPRGLPTAENPAIGPYKTLVDQGRDLHELHALVAPRPFLVSGGAEDTPARWKALNHAIAVNRLLGREHRVAMTNRPAHSPTAEANEVLYLFFEYFLKHGQARP